MVSDRRPAGPAPPRSPLPAGYLKICLFFVCLSAATAAGWMAERVGFPEPVRLVLAGLAVATVVHLGPALLLRRIPVDPAFAGGLLNLLSLGFVALLILLSWLPGPGMILVFAAAPILVLVALFELRDRISARGMLGGVLLLVLVAGVLIPLNLYRYHPPYAAELGARGRLDLDTLYHFSITQMFKFFGTPSIGIDGLLRIRYHMGSHFLLARLSALAGGEVPFTYSIFAHVLLVPLLLRSLAVAAMDFARLPRGISWAAPVLLTFAFLLMFGGIDLDAYLHSNSYLCSMILLLAAVPLLMRLRDRPFSRRDVPAWSLWACFVLLAPLTILSKVSTGLLLSIFGVYVILRLQAPLWFKAALVGLVGLLDALVYPLVVATSSELHFDPLTHDFNRFIMSGRYLFFLTINVFTIAYVLYRLREEGVDSVAALREAVRGRRVVDLEALLIVTALGMAPGRLFNHWSAYYYFDNVQMWIALPLVAGVLLRESALLRGETGPRAVLQRMNGTGVAILLLLAVTVTSMTEYVHQGVVGTIRRTLLARIVTFGEKPSRNWLRDRHTMARIWRPGPPVESPVASLVEQVVALRERYGRTLAVYVPISNTDYWNLYKECATKAIVLPALTGVPLLDGVPPIACRAQLELWGSHVYEDYAPRLTDRERDRESLCRLARAKGFRVVFRYVSGRDPSRNDLIRCDGEERGHGEG